MTYAKMQKTKINEVASLVEKYFFVKINLSQNYFAVKFVIHLSWFIFVKIFILRIGDKRLY